MYESFLEVDLVARVICRQSHRYITSYGTIRSSGDCLDWKYRRSTALGAIIIDRMDVTWLNSNANANANVNGSSRLESETTSTPSVRLRLRLRHLLIRYGPKSLMALLTVVTNDVDVIGVGTKRHVQSSTLYATCTIAIIRHAHGYADMPMAMDMPMDMRPFDISPNVDFVPIPTRNVRARKVTHCRYLLRLTAWWCQIITQYIIL